MYQLKLYQQKPYITSNVKTNKHMQFTFIDLHSFKLHLFHGLRSIHDVAEIAELHCGIREIVTES